MEDVLRPSLITRWAAGRRKGISTLQLEAYRRAGSSVYDLHLAPDRRRQELRAAGTHPFDAGPPSASLCLCAWNARVHQSLACEWTDADHRPTRPLGTR